MRRRVLLVSGAAAMALSVFQSAPAARVQRETDNARSVSYTLSDQICVWIDWDVGSIVKLGNDVALVGADGYARFDDQKRELLSLTIDGVEANSVDLRAA